MEPCSVQEAFVAYRLSINAGCLDARVEHLVRGLHVGLIPQLLLDEIAEQLASPSTSSVRISSSYNRLNTCRIASFEKSISTCFTLASCFWRVIPTG